MTLADVTNTPPPPAQETPSKVAVPEPPEVVDTPPVSSTPTFPPFSDEKGAPAAEPEPTPEPSAVPSPNALKEKLKALLSALEHEQGRKNAAFGVGNAAFAFAYFGGSSVANVASWAGLLYLLYGGVSSVFVGKAVARPPVTEEDLKPLIGRAIELANAVLSLHRNLFQCGEPKQALKGALVLYALTILSSRISTVLLLWMCFATAFAVPKALSAFETHITAAQTIVVEKSKQLNEVMEEKFPKKYAVPFAALAWLSYASYTTMALTLGVGCIGVQAWRESNPLAEAEVKELSSTAGAAIDKIKKGARRMSISAGDLFRPTA